MEPTGLNTFPHETSTIGQEDLSALLKVSTALGSTLNLNQVLQISIESTVNVLGLDTGAIYILDGGSLYLGATTPPLPPHFPEELRLARLDDHPHIQAALETRAPVFVKDARSVVLSPAEKVVVEARGLVSLLYFPLILKENATGAFIVGTTGETHTFTRKEIDLCHLLSNQVSLAVANAQLYQKTQQALHGMTQAYDATLVGWSRVLDMRDQVTDEHTRRVAEMTVAMAKRMGMPESEWSHVWRGALLHDIGKMGIPDSILQKPGPLTGAEWEIMQTHPVLAQRLLSAIDFLLPAIDIPYCHHERWDGSGYPRKLKGEEIPLAARLFAVVDVYDALTSDRPYRKAWTKAEALQYIQEQSGKQFYPPAVKNLLELLREQPST